jgi:hypothetical protein
MKRQRSSTLNETTSSHVESASPAAEAPPEQVMDEADLPEGLMVATAWGLFDLLPREVRMRVIMW